jgi:hypothetical protein
VCVCVCVCVCVYVCLCMCVRGGILVLLFGVSVHLHKNAATGLSHMRIVLALVELTVGASVCMGCVIN